MNKQDSDILKVLFHNGFTNQRNLSNQSGFSLGAVNKSIKLLMAQGYIDESMMLSDKAIKEIQEKSPKNAIILAAGYGMRMVPINMETSKGLIEVNGEPLVERIIKQLHEVGVTSIYIVVGFMKEQYEYLMDEYNVELIVNEDYVGKNNLHSVAISSRYLENAYIIPCDVWSSVNPFSTCELYSWYMVSNQQNSDSFVRVNRKGELVVSNFKGIGNAMIGISYITKDVQEKVKNKIIMMDKNPNYNTCFWEEALYEKEKMIVQSRVVDFNDVAEINTYEQLRELDSKSNQLKSEALRIIEESLHVTQKEIVDIQVLKKGMTNRSFLFTVHNDKYIMRIPGEGTDQLINRKQEASVYEVIRDKNICDDIAYINSENGYKITRFFENSRVCDPTNMKDLKKCMKVLKNFHENKFKVNHEFDIFKQLEFYESLWNGNKSIYRDYKKTKDKVFELKKYIDSQNFDKVLTHIDAVPDNFLFIEDGDIRLIDWEYAGMQDPHVDIAMFCIYSLYNKEQVDQLIDIYFEDACEESNRIKIYCYIAACGLLWSNWCEYKRNLGVEFGEYSLRQYRYAKEYYKIVQSMLNKE